MAVGVFAGIAVKDYASALKWYQRLLGAEPSFYPNDAEAVGMIWVDDPQAEAARIAERGLEPDDVERYGTVWKYVFHDADGNETGIGGDASAS